jgi:DNA-binding CsgD family transcriptional regulator
VVDNEREQARSAVAASQWGDAWRALSSLGADALDIDDLDRLATAAYMTGRDEDGFALWTRAHQLCIAEGSVHRAAAFGAKLGQTLGFKGDWSRASGWVERVANLLSEASIDCVEQGYLEWGQAMCRLFQHGDVSGAHDLFVRAGKTATRFRDRELTTMARIGEGRLDIYLGDIDHGFALLDEAAVAVEADELSPVSRGDAYCTLIDGVWELADLERCRDWTTHFTRWCDAQQELVLYRGNCLLHRAAMMSELGDWPTALSEVRGACARLAEPVNMLTLGGAHATEGDIHRLLGDFAEAEAAYARANDFGCQPQPGLALVRLAQGRVDVAAAMMQRVLAETQDPVARSNHLPAAVQIAVAAGDVEAATAAADELRDIAAELRTPLLRARASRARGTAALARGDASAALPELRASFTTCVEIGARHEAAQVRLLLADACRAVGDVETADTEEATARAALASFAGADAGPAPAAPDGLTDREAEVLRLLARGHTNRVIAEQLFISEKTVASHVSHIFTKIGVTSRAAATAYAYERGLT